MESTNDHAVNRLKILSSDQSFNKNTGALIVNGGIACKKTITAPCLNVDNLTIKKSTNITGDLAVDTLHVRETTILDGTVTINDNLIIDDLTVTNLTFDNLIPMQETSSIGSCSNRVYNIYNNYIDTNCIYVNDSVVANTVKTNNLIVGSDNCEHDTPVLNADNINKTIHMNVNELNICNEENELFTIDSSSIFINSLLRVKYQDLNITTLSYNLYVDSTIIIINSKTCTSIQLMKTIESGCSVSDGTFIKIYNKSCNCISINSHELASNGSIEFIFMVNKWITLQSSNGGESCDTEKTNCDTECKTECDSECNPTTTGCSDSSVFTVDNSHCK
jgi:hypothetical protein